MMKTISRALFFLVLMMLAAAATTDAQTMIGDPDDPTNQLYYQDPNEAVNRGGQYYYCAAKGRWGGYCRACTAVNGAKTCGDAQFSAKCQCNDPGCFNYTGSCTYEP